ADRRGSARPHALVAVCQRVGWAVEEKPKSAGETRPAHCRERTGTVIFIGHSLGADQALRFARKAKVAAFRLPLTCRVDPVSWDSNATQWAAGRWEVDDNVDRVLGFLSTSFPGEGRVFRATGNNTTDVSDVQLSLPHATFPGGLASRLRRSYIRRSSPASRTWSRAAPAPEQTSAR